MTVTKANLAKKVRSRVTPATQLKQLVQAAIEDVAEHRSNISMDTFALQPLNPVRIVLAFSGGRDSTALADVVSKLYRRDKLPSVAAVTVVHVNHGLSPHAQDWEENAKKMCTRWNLPLVIEHVYVNKALGVGIEAAAREARYKALLKVAKDVRADMVMTAHHLDDCLETFLIQWVRGAGPEGLAGMAPVRSLAKGDSTVLLSRPWLSVARSTIEAYVRRNRLTYVEDESNADTRYLRNLIRNDILPILDKSRPGWREAAARSVELVGETANILRSVGSNDVRRCMAEAPHALKIGSLLKLPISRQALCLRSWLLAEGIRPPSRARLSEALRQVRETQGDTKLSVRIGAHELRRWNGNIVLRRAAPTPKSSERDKVLVWNGERELSLGIWGGTLAFVPCGPDEDGFDAEEMRRGKLEVRSRKGGEKLKLWPLRPSRNLKHLFQQLKVPSFDRTDLPLIWLDGRLIFVAGLGGDCRCYPDRVLHPNRVKLVWCPDKPLLAE